MSLEQSGSASRGEGTLADLPLVEGAVAGAGAYVVGYLLTYVALFVDLEGSSDGMGEIGLEGAGILFYNAQFVRADLGGGVTRNFLWELARNLGLPRALDDPALVDPGSLTLPTITYTVLVAAVLVAAGFAVARLASRSGATATGGMEAGMTVVAGYLPLALLGSVLFGLGLLEWAAEPGAAPDVLGTILLAGLTFPLVFGAVGGHLAERF